MPQGLESLIFAIIFGALFGYDLVLGLWSTRWPRTKATILQATMPPSLAAKQKVVVGYTYQIDGKTFNSCRISYPNPRGKTRDDLAREFPEGSAVEIYYNPKSANHSCLFPGYKPNAMSVLFFIIFLTNLYGVIRA